MSTCNEVGIVGLRLNNMLGYNAICRMLRRENNYKFAFGNSVSPAMHAWPWDIWGSGNWRKSIITLDRAQIGFGAIFIDKPNAVCCMELGLLPQYRGQGYGGIAGRLLISKCFTKYGARLVESLTLSTNLRSIGMVDWMTLEGRLEARYLIDGQEVDELIYKITKSEWELRRVEDMKRQIDVQQEGQKT